MKSWRAALWVLVLVLLSGSLVLVAHWPRAPHHSTVRPNAVAIPVPTLTSVPAPALIPAVHLVAWHGPVEHVFFHPLVVDPRLAFRDDKLSKGFEDYFVTASEFRAIVDGLWRNGWTLVDAHRVMAGRVFVPAGRKPLVLSEDDVNYYRYFKGRGLASRLVLSGSGEVRAEVNGHESDDDLVPIIDGEVRRHPTFSALGAKGVLAVTGYEGLLGEHHVATDAAARERVRALASRLRKTGWSFASHTYGHIDLSRNSLRTLRSDTMRWRSLAGDLLGPVDLLVYPFGAPPSAAGVAYYASAGFPFQFDIGIGPRVVRRGRTVIMSRRHIDGLAFAVPRRLRPFFDVAKVRDPLRPTTGR